MSGGVKIMQIVLLQSSVSFKSISVFDLTHNMIDKMINDFSAPSSSCA
jgi:hypothetical protein